MAASSLLFLPVLVVAALEVTRPLVYLRPAPRRGPQGTALLPRPHWAITLAYWVATSALFVVIAVGALVSSFEAILALAIAALYNLLAYHSGAELTGTWSSPRFRSLGWPSPTYRILYELPTPASPHDDPQLIRTWRCTVAHYEPRRIFSTRRPLLPIADSDDATFVYYGNAGWMWAAFSSGGRNEHAAALYVGTRSAWPFAIPFVREAALLGGCISISWEKASPVKRVYIDASAVEEVYASSTSATKFIAMAQAGRNLAVGIATQYHPSHYCWEDLYSPLSLCKWQ